MLFKNDFLLLIVVLLTFNLTATAQTNIKYGPDYVVFEAEDTTLNNLWAVRTPAYSDYLKYLFYPGSSPDPISDTYVEYIGPWQGNNSDIEYKFICPKTGQYQMAMRLLTPLREAGINAHKFKYIIHPDTGESTKWEAGDARNDFFVKMEGNFTSAVPWLATDEELTKYIKFYGRGENRWGSCINLEHHPPGGGAKHGPAIYNFIEGEEYTLHLKGRSSTAIIDYIAFYNKSYVPHQNINHGTDLALLLPPAIRPYSKITGLEVVPSTAVVRKDKTTTLQVAVTPSDANGNVTWSSSNTSVMTVDATGVVAALGNIGDTAIITATSTIDNAVMATRQVEIVSDFSIAVSTVDIIETGLGLIEGQSGTLTTEVLPLDADNKTLVWSSADGNIATVDQTGKVTAVSEGTTMITATSADNTSIKDEITVEVVPFEETVVDFDDPQKYLTTNYPNAGTMEVNIDYNAGSLNTVSSMTLYLRHMAKGWARVVKDIKIDIAKEDLPDPQKGIYTHNIPVADITPAADLPEGDFYFLFVKMNASDGGDSDKGVQPVQIVDKALSSATFSLDAVTAVYPNPVKEGSLFVASQEDLSNKEGILYNLSGQPVLSATLENDNNLIDVSSLPSGVYLLQISDGDKVVASKQIIVE